MNENESAQTTVVLGADHGGFPHVLPLIQHLENQGLSVMSVGAEKFDSNDDYPKYAFEVGKTVAALRNQGKPAYGILLCRSGAGMTMAANKVKGIRATQAFDETQVKHARTNDDANVLTLSGEWLSLEKMMGLTTLFISTPFSNEERHQRRIDQISEFESI